VEACDGMSDDHPEQAPVLRALTPEAERALGGRPQVTLTRFPFRVGRESRGGNGVDWDRTERRIAHVVASNELYLLDRNRVKHISREHFQIELGEDGGYAVVDRGSACGTIVGERNIGGRRERGRCRLADGNVIVVGMAQSPYVFQFFAGGPARAPREQT